MTDYYDNPGARVSRARATCCTRACIEAGFRCTAPQGAYYIMADFSELSLRADDDYARWLTRGGSRAEHGTGVATVPGSSFYQPPGGRIADSFRFLQTHGDAQAGGARLREIAVEKPDPQPAPPAPAPSAALPSPASTIRGRSGGTPADPRRKRASAKQPARKTS